MTRLHLLLLALMALPALAPRPASAEEARCFADWSDAAAVAKQEQLVAVELLSRLAHGKLLGEIVKSTLCEEHGRYVYRLVVRESKGQLRNVTVDARQPFER
jgi:uncharacterized membrane protein YkoI